MLLSLLPLARSRTLELLNVLPLMTAA